MVGAKAGHCITLEGNLLTRHKMAPGTSSIDKYTIILVRRDTLFPTKSPLLSLPLLYLPPESLVELLVCDGNNRFYLNLPEFPEFMQGRPWKTNVKGGARYPARQPLLG